MLDRLLELGTVFDWLSPLASIAGDVANGPSHTFMIPQACGWTGGEVAGLLRRNGIETWGHMIVNGHIMITVRKPQAHFARYLLQQAGLPSGVVPSRPRWRPRARRRAPRPRRGRSRLWTLLRR